MEHPYCKSNIQQRKVKLNIVNLVNYFLRVGKKKCLGEEPELTEKDRNLGRIDPNNINTSCHRDRYCFCAFNCSKYCLDFHLV